MDLFSKEQTTIFLLKIKFAQINFSVLSLPHSPTLELWRLDPEAPTFSII